MIGRRDSLGRLAAAIRRLRREERGLTIVEGVVAALLLVLGALSVLQVFDASTRNNFRAEQSQVLNNRLQAELEAIGALPYDEIAMTGSPGSSGDPNDPRWRVQGASFAVARNGSDLKQMAINGQPIPGSDDTVEGGVVDPGPAPFSTGDISGEIYRFVTWTSDADCPACGSGVMKRVVVAANVDQAAVSFDRSFQEVHTDVADPEALPEDNPAPPGEEADGSTASFWLTDTTCDNSTRQETTADHPTHDTRGRCADGPQTGGERGAPDLMFVEAPALCEGCTIQDQELFDYSTDVSTPEPEPIGLTMPWAATDSCLLEPALATVDVKRLLDGVVSVLSLPGLPGDLDGVLDAVTTDPDKHRRVHTWVSPPVQGSGGVLAGTGTLELYTKTVNGTLHQGEICAWLSVRQEVEIPVCVIDLLGVCVPIGSTTIEVDLPTVNVGILSSGECRSGVGLDLSSFRYSQTQWPSDWTLISMPLCFVSVDAAGAVVPTALPPESRVALSLMVSRSGTEPGEGLELMYDAVGFESRLELATETVIPFG